MASALSNQQAIERFLTRGVEQVYPNRDVVAAALASGKTLTAYVGIDPTGPSLHIGHAISLRKLAELQKLGHKVILLIGDFTAMIGDPTDKSATRKPLTRDQVLANCENYRTYASRILSFEGPQAAEMRFNSAWLAVLSFTDVLSLASHFTVQQMMERDMFAKRAAEDKPVYIHEFLYPLMQGYDSVAMDVDMEIGGNDQTFNMLAGRTLMREIKQKEKFVVTCKLLVDPSGKKMGKTEGNMIALSDAPEDMYGKVMSWTDGMIVPGFELCTDMTEDEIAVMEKAMEAGENPMDFKKRLAHEIVRTFISEEAAQQGEARFVIVHQKQELPEEMPVFPVDGSAKLVDVLVTGKLVASKGEARRQIEQGGIHVNGQVISDIHFEIRSGMVIQKGKRHFLKLV